MSQTPFFSIVTPTYNRAQYVGQAIASVQQQEFASYEHIIVDDGSKDNTGKIVTEKAATDPRIRYIKQENRGRSAARNKAMELAKGHYICFLDSDDLWRPDHLSTLHKAISRSEGPSMYITGLIWLYETENREEKVIYRPRHLYTTDTEYVIINQFAPDCVCIPRQVAYKHRFNTELFVNEDVELWGRITSEIPVTTIDHYTAVLRIHDTNTANVEPRFMYEMRKVFKLQSATPSVRENLSEPFIADRIRGLHELTIKHYRQSNDRIRFLWWCAGFILRYPRNPSVLDKLKLMVRAITGADLN